MGATPYGVGASAGHRGTYTGPNGTTVQYNYKGGAAARPWRASAAGAHGTAVQGADGAGYAHGAHGAAVTGPGRDALPRRY
jgi:hypothetical protein